MAHPRSAKYVSTLHPKTHHLLTYITHKNNILFQAITSIYSLNKPSPDRIWCSRWHLSFLVTMATTPPNMTTWQRVYHISHLWGIWNVTCIKKNKPSSTHSNMPAMIKGTSTRSNYLFDYSVFLLKDNSSVSLNSLRCYNSVKINKTKQNNNNNNNNNKTNFTAMYLFPATNKFQKLKKTFQVLINDKKVIFSIINSLVPTKGRLFPNIQICFFFNFLFFLFCQSQVRIFYKKKKKKKKRKEKKRVGKDEICWFSKTDW